MVDRVTAPKLQKMREKSEKIVCVTAYDTLSGALAQEAGVDVILVGDSLGNTVLGYETTLPVTMDDIIHHLRAVRRVVNGPLLVADMPFGSYNVSPEQATQNAITLMKSGAEAVKLEGDYPEAIDMIFRAGIPVMGHVGFTPQSVHRFGGFKVQGRGKQGEELIKISQTLESNGAFAVVLELIPAELAKSLTNSLSIPTIGIGAGPDCSGEIQVFHDIMGLSEHSFKHSRQFAKGRQILTNAMKDYVANVRQGQFPSQDNSF